MANRLGAVAMVALAGVLGGCGGKEAQYYRGAGDLGPGESTTAPVEPAPEDPGSSLPPSSPPPPRVAPPAACSASFGADIAPIFQARQCSNSNCHGGQVPRNLPRIDPTSLFATWTALRSFTLSDGRPYVNVNASDPKLSGMHCNLRGECGVSMPPTFDGNTFVATEYAAIDAWLACGAPFN